MEFVAVDAKVTKLDMNYPGWSPDMTELFGQEVDICGVNYNTAYFKRNESDDVRYTVKLENGNYYTIPKDWLTFIKKKRKTTSYEHKLVCISADESRFFTVGKVYLFDKGVLFDDSDDAWNEGLFDDCALTYAQNVEDINAYFSDVDGSDVKFIEYVE